MDWKDIDRLRDPRFTVARRGYDQREVDRLLGTLVDWLETDAAKDLGDLAVQRKLEFVSKSTARILLTTEEEAVQLRRITEEECRQLRTDAEAASRDARQAADKYADEVRTKADEDAHEITEGARAHANQLVEEGERRRAEIEAVVSDLEARRDSTIKELDRLRSQLSSTLGTHEPEAAPPKRTAAKPGENGQKAKQPGAVAKA
jgi:DivIVA domain-containing protein